MREETPNDPKLSDGGAWRGSCEGGAQKKATDVGQRHDRAGRVQARLAATVTRGAVRCSAWLGVTWTRRGLGERVWITVEAAKDAEMGCDGRLEVSVCMVEVSSEPSDKVDEELEDPLTKNRPQSADDRAEE